VVTLIRRPRGETLVLTLITLLVLCLGFLYTLRSVTLDAQMAGNTLARQKDTQVADIALRNMESQILAVYGAQPLEVSASSQTWFRAVSAGTAAPDYAYWSTCLGNSNTAQRCGALTVTVNNTLAYSVLAVVQPTGQSDAYACGLSQYRALYYDIFLNVAEPNGATSTTVETIYRVCTLS
jgi:Tfp pilus assembly protein PilX